MQLQGHNYEISIWTLQDEFISVLKPFGFLNNQLIIDGKFLIKDDGTQELSFSIPMYIYKEGTRIENPSWYNVREGIIVQNMRKIKIIFNKKTEVERVFEFLIINIEQTHENDEIYCNVKCEGLAFNELGKQGYKISLSSEIFNNNDYNWFVNKEWFDNKGRQHREQPKGTINYWLDQFLIKYNKTTNIDSTQWYYSIEMDWNSFDTGRDSSKIYEEEYTLSWDNNLNPLETEPAKEKERMIDLEESNIYNLTQDIAKIFGVFCRYEYTYNNNYNISGRKIIFYNNYMKEKEGYLDLTYPYSASSITREIDSNDIVTKMYIRPVTDNNSSSGLITIMDVGANKSKEDYLLNFDYLYNIGSITEEQYTSIKSYEKEIRNYNIELKKIEDSLNILYNKKIEVDAAITIHTNAVQLDKERLSASNSLLNELDIKDGDSDGYITIGELSPHTGILLPSSSSDGNGSYYLNITQKGVVLESLHIYKRYNYSSKKLEAELTSGVAEYDEFGNIIKIKNLSKEETDSSTVYLIYKYNPKLYYNNIFNTWSSRLVLDETKLNEATEEQYNIENKITFLNQEQTNYLGQKNECIEKFNKMMGPALRESYWQPEDYNNYGNNYIDDLTLGYIYNDEDFGSSNYTKIFWDNELFDDEQQVTYKITAAEYTKSYPCIRLKNYMNSIKGYWDNLSFMYFDCNLNENNTIPYNSRTIRNTRNFPIGATCQYGFTRIYNQEQHQNWIEPVLIITGLEGMSQAEILKIKYKNPMVGILTTSINDMGEINITKTPLFTVEEEDWLLSTTLSYMPRIKINSLSLKTDNSLTITYAGKELEKYKDYYILTRDNSFITENTSTFDSAYYITIKPEVLIRSGTYTGNVKLKFNISNADTAIYLDAWQILKENSQPKVSYEVDANLMNKDFLYTLYNNLNRICNINDTDLKLKNVQGYISEIEIDLDNPENDKVEIKNYKNKFEDLFSTIIAQTEEMRKDSYGIDLATASFLLNGNLNEETLQNSINDANISLSFNKGKLTITEEEGIMGSSNGGIVNFRNNGIFTASEKDGNGNWKWNTAITSEGINANLITTGQLDTNRIKIYAGDRLRFQLNSEGIFAYKSFMDDFNENNLSSAAITKINNSDQRFNDIDMAQYVVMNQNGLFLVGEKGGLVLNKDKNDYISIQNTVNRVEISWEGLKLRNWENEEVFYADADTGDLTLSGTIYSESGRIGGWRLDKEMLISGQNSANTVGMSANLLPDEIENISYNTKIPKGDKTLNTEAGYYAFWAGNSDPHKAPFRVTRDGKLFIERLIVANPADPENITIINNYETFNLSNTNNVSSGGSGGGSGGTGGGAVDFYPENNISISGEWGTDTDSNKYTATANYKFNNKNFDYPVSIIITGEWGLNSDDDDNDDGFYGSSFTVLESDHEILKTTINGEWTESSDDNMRFEVSCYESGEGLFTADASIIEPGEEEPSIITINVEDNADIRNLESEIYIFFSGPDGSYIDHAFPFNIDASEVYNTAKELFKVPDTYSYVFIENNDTSTKSFIVQGPGGLDSYDGTITKDEYKFTLHPPKDNEWDTNNKADLNVEELRKDTEGSYYTSLGRVCSVSIDATPVWKKGWDDARNKMGWPSYNDSTLDFSIQYPDSIYGNPTSRSFSLNVGNPYMTTDYGATYYKINSTVKMNYYNSYGQNINSTIASVTTDITSVYNEVTVSSIMRESNRNDWYDSSAHTTTIYVKATASNGNSKSTSFTTGTQAYESGYDAALDKLYEGGVFSRGNSNDYDWYIGGYDGVIRYYKNN